MSGFERLWKKFASNKGYRDEFVSGQLKRGIPFQISSIMKARNISQLDLAERSGLSQGAISRAVDVNYGNLTLNTIIRIAAGLDMAFVGKFVPFSDLGSWFVNLSTEHVSRIPTFNEENAARQRVHAGLAIVNYERIQSSQVPSLPTWAEINPSVSIIQNIANDSIGGVIHDYIRPTPMSGRMSGVSK